MLRKITALLTLFAVLILSSCGNGSAASDKAISCANEAVKTAEGYLAFDIEYKEAYEKISELQEKMSYLSEMNSEDAHYFADTYIRNDIAALSLALVSDNYENTPSTYDKISEIITQLKEHIK